MAVDRELFQKGFTEATVPNWPCPECGATLLLDKESLRDRETTASRTGHRHRTGGPPWGESTFCCLLHCSRQKECREPVALVGKATEDVDADERGETILSTYYEPVYFFPALRLFSVPDAVPKEVREFISQAFSLFKASPPGCVGRIRAAIEKMLSIEGIPLYPRRGRRRPLPLHSRIELWRKKAPTLADKLIATKWIANEGVHRSVTIDDAFDALDILEFVLEEHYGRRSHAIQKLSTEIIKRKRPRSAVRPQKGQAV